MKRILFAAVLIAITIAHRSSAATLEIKSLRLELDDTGKLTALSIADGRNRLDSSRPSPLLMLQVYGEKQLRHPTAVRCETISDVSRRLVFSYGNGFSATVEAKRCEGYLRLELLKAEPLKEIAKISWGPVNTIMKGPFAEYLGLIRDDNLTIGMLSLEPNTDGTIANGGHYYVAWYNGTEGSYLQALALDHTLSGNNQDGTTVQAIPGVTVQGSAIALFGCTRKAELDTIDAISQAEKLPRPTINGVWNKRSTAHFIPALWVHYNQGNLADYLEMCRIFGANSICNFHDMFGNWGHFTPDRKLYPRGLESLRETVQRCKAAGVGHVMYTLSTFIRTFTIPEPFITPKPQPGIILPRSTFMGCYTPGTIEMQDAVADNIARVARECDFPQVTIDGYESCLRTGHGAYAKNRFVKRLFEQAGNPELRITPSNFGNYDWHYMSYISWGEWDLVKGFRGTMIDYRIRRQLQLENNLIPHKMGQYYPDDATPQDMEWLMAVSAGWNAGVDMHFRKASPKSEKVKQLGEIVRLWMAARQANAFTDAKKLGLRQTDRHYHLSRATSGQYDLKFVGRWTHPGMVQLPASVFKIKPYGSATVAPRSIDWSWTHNPGIYLKAGLSDDLVCAATGKPFEWQVTYPNNDRLQFVLRVPADAPCAVRNPAVTLNNTLRLTIPVTLQPGQYLSTTHDMSLVSVYDQNHEVIAEANIQCLPYRLPEIKGGTPQRIGLSAEPVNPTLKPTIRLNLRTHVIFGADI